MSWRVGRPTNSEAIFEGDQFRANCVTRDEARRLVDLLNELDSLRADKERLDWLESESGRRTLIVHDSGHVELNPDGKIANWRLGKNVREAIDQARSAAENGKGSE